MYPLISDERQGQGRPIHMPDEYITITGSSNALEQRK